MFYKVRWLILAPTTITQVYFFQITLSFRIQWTGLLCNSHFVTWSIKHTYSQDLTFHKINIIFYFIEVILKRICFFVFLVFFKAQCHMVKNMLKITVGHGLYLDSCQYARSLPVIACICPWECQHGGKGRWCCSIIMTSFMTSWTMWKCLKSPKAWAPLLRCWPVAGHSQPWLHTERVWNAFYKYLCSSPKPD